jgi:hypothetical protein
MPNAYKILGQVAASGAANTDLYTTPSGYYAVTSTLSACALGASSYVRVACIPSGQSIDQKNYIMYDSYVNQYDSLFLTLGVTLNQSEKITVYASGGGPVAFSLFGTEIN